jgi:hypothetical protein
VASTGSFAMDCTPVAPQPPASPAHTDVGTCAVLGGTTITCTYQFGPSAADVGTFTGTCR